MAAPRGARVTAFQDAGTVNITTSGSNATGTVVSGALYKISASVAAYCRWGASAATASSGGAAFMVTPGESLYVRVPSGLTTLNAIQVSAAGVVSASRVDESEVL
jgi:hypothetical protein